MGMWIKGGLLSCLRWKFLKKSGVHDEEDHPIGKIKEAGERGRNRLEYCL